MLGVYSLPTLAGRCTAKGYSLLEIYIYTIINVILLVVFRI